MVLHHLDDGVGGLGGDAALVAAVAGHLDVAGLTPAAAPGVLDQPVAVAVAHHQDTMVQGERVALGLTVVDKGEAVRRGAGGRGQRKLDTYKLTSFNLMAVDGTLK